MNSISRGPTMNLLIRDFDWPRFWFLELLSLSVPALTAVVIFGRKGHAIPLRIAAISGLISVALTILNILMARLHRPENPPRRGRLLQHHRL